MSASTPPRICPACGAPNRCALDAGRAPETCWCLQQAQGLPLPGADARCYCPACFARLAHAAQGDRHAR